MSNSFSVSESQTFTILHAKHMSAKAATDLKRLQRLYGLPSDSAIADYEAELVIMIKAGYLGTVTYGYRKDGKWIEPTLRYTAKDLAGSSSNDDDPGKIKAGANIDGASFHSYLTYSDAWNKASAAERETAQKESPVKSDCCTRARKPSNSPP
jgi:hypothetical protein